MDTSKLIDELVRDEGLRLRVYSDCKEDEPLLARLKGKLTIGIGRNLQDNGITKETAYHLCIEDIEDTAAGLDQYLPWWRKLDEVRQRVMVNMAFNLGIWPEKKGKLLSFGGTLAAIKVGNETGNFKPAADHMRATRWFQQVGVRGERLVKMMETGVAVALLLLAACTKEVKVQSAVQIASATEDVDHEVDHDEGEQLSTSKAERREEREPETEVSDTKVEVAATPTTPAKVVTRHVVKVRGKVIVDQTRREEKVAKVESDVHKDAGKKSTTTTAAATTSETKTDVGPGWKFYLTVFGCFCAVVVAAYCYLKLWKKVSWR